MALVRARPVGGPAGLCARIAALRREILCAPRDPDQLLRDVASMRARIARSNRSPAPWDVKQMPGGLVDVEFTAQYLVLRHAHAHPEIGRASGRERVCQSV